MSRTFVPSDAWRVVVFGRPDDFQEVADLLSRSCGLNHIDALQHARAAPGLLPDALPRPVAERLVMSLGELGLSATAVPQSAVPDLEAAQHIHHVRCSDIGLQALDLRGDVAETIRWIELKLLSIGTVPEESVRRFDPEGPLLFNSAPAMSARGHPFPMAEGPEAWLIAEPCRVLRIDHLQMNYEYLGAQKSHSAAVNFRRFIEDVLRHAPHLHRTPATRAWLENLPAERFRFNTPAELERDTLVHWFMVRAPQITAATTAGTLAESTFLTDGARPNDATSTGDHVAEGIS